VALVSRCAAPEPYVSLLCQPRQVSHQLLLEQLQRGQGSGERPDVDDARQKLVRKIEFFSIFCFLKFY